MKQKKIFFEHRNSLESSFGIESAWATPISKNLFKLDNILFYAKDYSLGDIVKVKKRNQDLIVIGLEKESGHSTVRIIFNDERDVNIIREKLKELGCESEISNSSILISVDIPSEVKYNLIKSFLEQGEKLSKWVYEEACIAHTD